MSTLFNYNSESEINNFRLVLCTKQCIYSFRRVLCAGKYLRPHSTSFRQQTTCFTSFVFVTRHSSLTYFLWLKIIKCFYCEAPLIPTKYNFYKRTTWPVFDTRHSHLRASYSSEKNTRRQYCAAKSFLPHSTSFQNRTTCFLLNRAKL